MPRQSSSKEFSYAFFIKIGTLVLGAMVAIAPRGGLSGRILVRGLLVPLAQGQEPEQRQYHDPAGSGCVTYRSLISGQ
jgi:hypothetical protein